MVIKQTSSSRKFDSARTQSRIGRQTKPRSNRRQVEILHAESTVKNGYFSQKSTVIAQKLLPVNVNGGFQRQNVRIDPKPGDLPDTNRCDQRSSTEFFARMNVRQMDFYGRNSDSSDGIAYGHACMRVSGRVQNDHVEFALRLVNPGHQFSLQIALLEFDLCPHLFRPLSHFSFYSRQSRPPINFRLTLAEQIQVWSVEIKNLHCGCRRYCVNLALSISIPPLSTQDEEDALLLQSNRNLAKPHRKRVD